MQDEIYHHSFRAWTKLFNNISITKILNRLQPTENQSISEGNRSMIEIFNFTWRNYTEIYLRLRKKGEKLKTILVIIYWGFHSISWSRSGCTMKVQKRSLEVSAKKKKKITNTLWARIKLQKKKIPAFLNFIFSFNRFNFS